MFIPRSEYAANYNLEEIGLAVNLSDSGTEGKAAG